MIEGFEKAILAGVGMLSLTEKKSAELVDEIRKKFNLTEDEGRELLDKFRKNASENQQKLEELAREEIQKTCTRMGVVSQKDFDTLASLVGQLEQRIALLEKRLAGEV